MVLADASPMVNKNSSAGFKTGPQNDARINPRTASRTLAILYNLPAYCDLL